MATKTISLEIDAYEKLRKAKRAPSESFSSVVRRAVFPDQPCTASELLVVMEQRLLRGDCPLDEAALDRLDAAQASPRVSEAPG
jgi:hypothetical protein